MRDFLIGYSFAKKIGQASTLSGGKGFQASTFPFSRLKQRENRIEKKNENIYLAVALSASSVDSLSLSLSLCVSFASLRLVSGMGC